MGGVMARVTGFIVLLAVLVFGLFFGLLNAEPVKLDYYLGSRELPLSLVLVSTLLLGALIGAFASIGMVLRYRRKIARLEKEISSSKRELSNLRTLSISTGNTD